MATAMLESQAAPLASIHVPENVRDLDQDHVDALARSIALQGMLVPVVVRPAGEGFELVAGFHRAAAAAKLGLAEVPIVVRGAETEDVDRAVENIARKQLNPYEEARAVKAILDRGLTEQGAADVLGWSIHRVAARVKILGLPERAQQMIGAGEIPLSAIDQLLAIGRVAPALRDAVVSYLDDGNQWAAERLASEPGWVLDSAMREGGVKTFASYMDSVSSHEITELRLGKKAEDQLAEAEKLHKQVTPYSYGPPPIRFTEQDVDQARAAGVLIEFERGRPIIVDRALYRELAKTALKRAVGDLRVRAAELAEQKKRAGKGAAGRLENPAAEADHRRDEQLRGLAEQAHGVNLDLGSGLLKGLSSVDPLDMNVARFFVYALLGPDYDGSSWTKTGERIHHLASAGIRLVVEDLRTDVTRTRKDGSRGRLRMDYGDPKDPEAAIRWLWRYVDGASTPGELFGRALVVIAAEQYAARMVLPASQRTYRMHWGSHKDIAAKALKKLLSQHLPASLKALERAVERVHSEHGSAIEQLAAAPGRDAGPDAEVTGGEVADNESEPGVEVADEGEVGQEDQ